MLAVLAVLSPRLAEAQDDPFRTLIRPTPFRSPQEQLQAFHLPPGFTIQLVAAEPDLLKPMNLAFDGRGRLWVTMSQEYPYPRRPIARAATW